MKILITAETYPPDVNGSAQFSRRLAHGLLGRGHEVHVAAPMPTGGPSRVVVDEGVVEHRFRSHHAFTHPYFRLCFPWEIAREVSRLLDELEPDVVHVLADGRIVESGGAELALELEQHGYAWLKDRVAPGAAA